jgi:hypothetical protein
MLGLFWFNWEGTPEELKKFVEENKKETEKIDGITWKGCYTPTCEWNRVMVFKIDSADKWYAMSTSNPNVSLGKGDVLIDN